MKLGRVLLGLGITGLWLYMMQSVYQREYGFQADPGGAVIGETVALDSWAEYSLLSMGERDIATVATVIRREPAGGYAVEHRGRFEHRILEQEFSGILVGESRFDDTLALRGFLYTLRVNGRQFAVVGEADDALLTLRLRGYNLDQEQVLPLDGPLRIENGLTPFLVQRPDFAAGKKYRFNTFDPISQSTRPVVMEVADSDRDDADYVLIARMGSHTVSSWVTRDGETVFQATDFGLTTQGISRQSALALDAEAAHPVHLYLSAPVEAELDTAGLTRVTVQFAGLHPRDYPILDARQHEDGGPERYAFLHGPVGAASAEAPEGLALYRSLEKVPGQIRANAAALQPSAGGGVAFVDGLYDWMRERQRVAPAIDAGSALDAYLLRQGDGRSLTRLAVTMARACGYPARCVSGLVYRPGGYTAHYWPEVWSGEWIGFDPVLGARRIGPEYMAFAAGLDIDEEKMRRIVRTLRIDAIVQEHDHDTHGIAEQAL